MKLKVKNAILCFFVVFLAGSRSFSSENNIKVDPIFKRVATELTHTDPDEALRIADSLFVHSTNKTIKIKALMLSANVYQHLNDYDKALVFGKKAERLLTEEKDTEWRVRILGFIASQYRNIGVYSEGEKFIAQSELALEKITDPLKRALCKVLILQEKGYYALAKKEYDAGLSYLKESNLLFDGLPDFDAKGYHKAITEEVKGRIYLEQHDFDKAKQAFLEAKKQLDPYNTEEYPLYGYIYSGLGKIAIENNEPREVVEDYYRKALAIAESSFNVNLKRALYESIVDFFRKEENWEKYGEYSEKLKLEQAKTVAYKNETINQLFTEVKEEKLLFQESNKFYLTFSLILLSVSLLIVLVFCRARQLKYKKKYVKALAYYDLQIAEKNQIKGVLEKQINDFEQVKPKQGGGAKKEEFKIPDETKDRIMGKIQEFEDKLLYLEPSLSISFLASFCDTNIRYISIILKDKEEQDFSSYINSLRVYYIIKKLKEEKEYRNYKISYLAEEAGFSSHSKFSSVFKQIVGLSPSEFIDLHTKFETTES